MLSQWALAAGLALFVLGLASRLGVALWALAAGAIGGASSLGHPPLTAVANALGGRLWERRPQTQARRGR
jgi:hypothetical protein